MEFTDTVLYNTFGFMFSLVVAFGLWVLFLKITTTWKEDEWFPAHDGEDADKKLDMEISLAIATVVACVTIWWIMSIPSKGSPADNIIDFRDNTYLSLFDKKA